jgi:hypothetical protein
MLRKKALLKVHPLLNHMEEVAYAERVNDVSYHILDINVLQRPILQGETWVALTRTDTHYIPVSTKLDSMPVRYKAPGGRCLVDWGEGSHYDTTPAIYNVSGPTIGDGIYNIGTYDLEYVACVKRGELGEVSLAIYIVPDGLKQMVDEAVEKEVERLVHSKNEVIRKYKESKQDDDDACRTCVFNINIDDDDDDEDDDENDDENDDEDEYA